MNQTSVVHEELFIPKQFGDLLVSGFTIFVNGIKLSEDVVIVDDYFADGRIVHFMIYKKELINVFENNSNNNGMDFVIKPDRDYVHLRSVTENGQFGIFVSWEPENLKSNSNAKIIFDVTDTFLKNKPVATTYEFSMTKNDRVIFEQSGISSDSKDEHNIVEFMIPEDVTGIVHLNFKNLDNNSYAKTTIPIVINRVINQNYVISIPDWIRNNAKWWAEGQINDDTFVQGIQFLIKERILLISGQPQATASTEGIPDWIKNNDGWWADGIISEDDFVNGIKYLVEKGIVRVN